jgi:RHH-type transcriptional regulator, rel operon repressor / antitoxin RelB
MLSLELPLELERRLNELATKTKRSTYDCVVQALEEFLDENEDFLLTSDEEGPNISLDEAKKLLGFLKEET